MSLFCVSVSIPQAGPLILGKELFSSLCLVVLFVLLSEVCLLSDTPQGMVTTRRGLHAWFCGEDTFFEMFDHNNEIVK
jgi:hypothetical protein